MFLYFFIIDTGRSFSTINPNATLYKCAIIGYYFFFQDISIFIVGDGIYEIFQKQLQTLDTTESEHRGKRSFNDGFKPRRDQNQRQWQRRGSDRQVHRGPHNHSGSRASSNSSSNSRESSDRKRHFEDPKNGIFKNI